MATTAQYTAEPIIDTAILTTGDTSRSAPTTVTEIAAGPSVAAAAGKGKRINRVTVTQANAVRFFIEKPGSNTKHLVAEKAITSITSSGTAIGFRTEVPELVGLILPADASDAGKLFASVHTTDTIHITVESGLL
jgi:hypothetical protein